MSKSFKGRSEGVGGGSEAVVEVKSKFDAEWRRFSVRRGETPPSYESFRRQLEQLHQLASEPFQLSYTDPSDGDLLPINNDENYGRALKSARPLLRVLVQRQGDSLEPPSANGHRAKNLISHLLGAPKPRTHLPISNPHDFRQVSAIIDVDVVPDTCRRVRLLKHGSDKPLGFYIRDGTSVRVTAAGLEKVPGIFISRLVPGGLAESTGLLAVNDEVLEVNGIEVSGKTLDQVTDMMVANSSNLIITVKPANQPRAAPVTTLTAPRRGSFSRTSQLSSDSAHSVATESDADPFDQDEIVDLTGAALDADAAADERADDSAVMHL